MKTLTEYLLNEHVIKGHLKQQKFNVYKIKHLDYCYMVKIPNKEMVDTIIDKCCEYYKTHFKPDFDYNNDGPVVSARAILKSKFDKGYSIYICFPKDLKHSVGFCRYEEPSKHDKDNEFVESITLNNITYIYFKEKKWLLDY